MGLGGEGRGKGEEVRGWRRGLLNFHLIFQKILAEPGNLS